MDEKFRRFLDLFSAGGVVRSRFGTAIQVSAHGGTSVPASEYKKIVFKQFEDMKRAGRSNGHVPAAFKKMDH